MARHKRPAPAFSWIGGGANAAKPWEMHNEVAISRCHRLVVPLPSVRSRISRWDFAAQDNRYPAGQRTSPAKLGSEQRASSDQDADDRIEPSRSDNKANERAGNEETADRGEI